MPNKIEPQVSAIVATITDLAELDGFASALKSPDGRTVTIADWQAIALRRAELQRGRK